jgi:hypothetical protein
MSSITKELKKLQDEYESAEPAEGFSGGLPDGDYVVKISDMEINHSKNGRLQVKVVYKVEEPAKYEGEEIWDFWGLDEQGFPYFKLNCNKVGIELPDDLEELPDILEKFVDDNKDTIELTLKTKNDFQNKYINSEGAAGDDDDKKKPDNDDDEEEKIKALKSIIKKNKLKIDPSDYDDSADLGAAVKKALKKKKK